MPDRKALSWKAVSYGAGAVAAFATRQALAMLWNQFETLLRPNRPLIVESPGFPL